MYTTSDREPQTYEDVVEFDVRAGIFEAIVQFVRTRGRPVVVHVPASGVEYAERTMQQVAAGLTGRGIVEELREAHGLPPCWTLDVAALLRAVRFEAVPGL